LETAPERAAAKPAIASDPSTAIPRPTIEVRALSGAVSVNAPTAISRAANSLVMYGSCGLLETLSMKILAANVGKTSAMAPRTTRPTARALAVSDPRFMPGG
jgi:hypothetical protein